MSGVRLQELDWEALHPVLSAPAVPDVDALDIKIARTKDCVSYRHAGTTVLAIYRG